ncbi:MAG: hypothetical protein U0527_05890 [Candidatus Eisenbacteria bacterium]
MPAEAELDARRLAAEAASVAAALRVVRAAWPEAEPDADLASWARREREAERRARELLIQESALEARRAGTLRAHSLATSTELATRRLETTAALGAVLRELEALEAKDPLLASSREERDPLVRGETLRRVMREEAQSDEAEQAEVVRLEEANRQLLREQARLEGKQGVNVARLELGARALESEIRARKQEAAALVLASSWLREAAHDYQGDHRAELEARLSRHFRHLSLSDSRRVTLGSSFDLALASHAGHAIAIAQLSQGTRDQLFLALRLAVADLLNGPAALPFLFDDPFVHFDEERLARVKQSLEQLGQERQWLLLSHRGDLASWARAIEIRPL